MTTPEPIRFDDPTLVLPEALRRALAGRGYETAMPVQAAILAPAARGRDLLVSSPTGSGKTIAFGAALAETLLDGAGGPAAVVAAGDGPAAFAAPVPAGAARSSGPPPPRALVVVPTRELAIQVCEELGWLLAGTKLRLASFTGGTAVSGDLRALRRGVDVAIGTPGRLCDLLRRQSLPLASLAVAVLDEADEMLDLGFREDLETLLGAAPAARRTLMFSATLPTPMRALAKRFQRDALAIDARRANRSAADAAQPGAHEDITYVAHLIAGDDRLAAVINVLRGSDSSRAIVFCTRRDAVGGLHRELTARGFAATAISGERAQAERDRALDQLRQGEARILVATNVAARGLHLPDVDLIVHADLPLNVESLTHRSGRTGRAGRKGIAVVIASLAERRKAERLFMAARLRPEWTAPPSARAIATAARARLADTLAGVAGGAGEANETPAVADDEVDLLLAELRERMPIDQVARRLLARELARLPVGEPLLPVPLPSAGGARNERNGFQPDARRRGPADFARAGVLFRVNLGAQDQADPRWLLPLICRRGGVTRREVGAIRVGLHETLFEIAGDAAGDFALSASQSDPRAPNVRVERVDSGGAGGDVPRAAPARVENGGGGGGGPGPRAPHARAESKAGAPAPDVRIERRPARPLPAGGGGGFQPPARRSASGPPPAAAARDSHRPRTDDSPARARGPHSHARPAHPSARPAHGRPAHGPAHPRPHSPPHPLAHPRARKPRG